MKKQLFGKGSAFLFVALIAGVLLLLLSSVFSFDDPKENEVVEEDFELCEKRCEERIASILSKVDGVSDVSVMVTLDELPSDKERPRVRGVAVVCEGAENSELRLKIVMLVSAALGVTSDRIFVTFS